MNRRPYTWQMELFPQARRLPWRQELWLNKEAS